MRDEILLSIIIPVYNVEKYLNECVDSVLMQLTEECEIILVDDGSTDSSGDICQWYALNNSQVRVIRKDNGGLSSARNSGMKIAKGKYISFVDSDDVIFSGSIAEILNWIKSKGTDMCFMRAVKFYPDGTQIDLGEGIVRSELESKSKEDAVKYLASRPKYPGSAWAKLYRREFLTEYDLHFPYDRRYSEDLGFIRDCILNAHDFDALEIPFYLYRQNRQGSITNKITSKNFYDLLCFITESVEILTDNKATKNYINKEIMSFVAYEYCILLYLYSFLHEDERNNAYNSLKSYRWVMRYAKNKKSKLVCWCLRFFGIRFTAKLLNKYHG